jgi:hypothetical protein
MVEHILPQHGDLRSTVRFVRRYFHPIGYQHLSDLVLLGGLIEQPGEVLRANLIKCRIEQLFFHLGMDY